MNRRGLFKFLAAIPLLAVGSVAAAKVGEENRLAVAWSELLDAQAFASYPGHLVQKWHGVVEVQNPDGGVTVYLDQK
jgi:hypothetical protein